MKAPSMLCTLEHPSSEEEDDFTEEMSLMKKLEWNEHILSMLGCCTASNPRCLVLEYMEYGDLLHFLRDRRKKVLSFNP